MSNIKINLLLKEYAPPRRAGAVEWGVAAVAALAMVAIGVYYMGVAADASEMNERAASQGKQLHVVKAQLAEAGSIRQREERVARAEGELKGLVGRNWSTILLTLRDLTPQYVTWNSLDIDGDTMTLKATSQGLVDVAQLFAGLIVNQQVAEVSLHYVTATGVRVEFRAEQGTEMTVPEAEIRPAGELRQLDFEISITLTRQEGGESRGA